MKNLSRFISMLLAMLLLASAFVFTSNAESGALSVDTATVDGTPGNPGEGIANLFDGSVSSKYCTMNATAELTFALNEAAIVTYYEMVSANDAPERDPKAWTLYGSDDGEDWTAIDEQTDVDFEDRFTMNCFTFENTVAYKWYKIDVTENHGAGILQFAELALYTASPVIVDDGSLKVLIDTVTGPASHGGSPIKCLFDGEIGTKYVMFSEDPVSEENPAEIVFSLNKAFAVNCCTMISGNDWDARDPVVWALYGSNDEDDEKTWTELTDSEGRVFGAARLAENVYTFTNDTEYKWYKLTVTGTRASEPYNAPLQLSELILSVVDPGEIEEMITVDPDSIEESSHIGSHEAKYLFDGQTGAECKYLAATNTGWVSFALTEPKAINTYTMYCTSDRADRYPMDWSFYGSDDRENWTLLDSRSGEAGAGYAEGTTYTFPNELQFRYYKLDLTKNSGGDFIGLAEFTVAVTDNEATIDRQVKVDTASVTAPAHFSNHDKSCLFNGKATDKYLKNDGDPTGQISFALEKAAPVNRIVLFANDRAERTPKDFDVYGSEDGKAWTLLASIEGVTVKDDICGAAVTFDNDVAYKFYKIDVQSVRAGTIMAIAEMTLHCISPAEGRDILAPESVSDLTGITEAVQLNSLTIKSLIITAKSAEALGDLGAVTVYGNDIAEETDEVKKISTLLSGYDNITYVNDLTIGRMGIVAEKKNLTAIGSILSDMTDYQDVSIVMTFKSGDQVVKVKEKTFTTVYTTINRFTSTNEMTAAAQGLDYVEAKYLFALTVKGIQPENGEDYYDVEITVYGNKICDDGTVVAVAGDTRYYVMELELE